MNQNALQTKNKEVIEELNKIQTPTTTNLRFSSSNVINL